MMWVLLASCAGPGDRRASTPPEGPGPSQRLGSQDRLGAHSQKDNVEFWPGENIHDLWLSPDGRYVAITDNDALTVFERGSAKPKLAVNIPKNDGRSIFSSDKAPAEPKSGFKIDFDSWLYFSKDGRRLGSIGSDGDLCEVDLQTGAVTRPPKLNIGSQPRFLPINCAAGSPDLGRYVYAASTPGGMGFVDPNVLLLDSRGKLIWSGKAFLIHISERKRPIQVSQDKPFFAVASREVEIKSFGLGSSASPTNPQTIDIEVRRLTDGGLFKRLTITDDRAIEAEMNGFSFATDGSKVAFSQTVLEVASGKELRKEPTEPQMDELTASALDSKSGFAYLISGAGDDTKLYYQSLNGGKVIKVAEFPNDPFSKLEITPDSRWIAVESMDGVRLIANDGKDRSSEGQSKSKDSKAGLKQDHRSGR